MRPAGDIRLALRDCFPLQGEGAATWHHALAALGLRKLVNPAAPGERKLVRRTVENMLQAAELVPVEPVRVEGSRRPAMGYARPAPQRPTVDAGLSLAQVVTAWR